MGFRTGKRKIKLEMNRCNAQLKLSQRAASEKSTSSTTQNTIL